MNFSIIIPARNEEKNIGPCLHSIASVDWPREDFEVLVVDNGSVDRTVSIARSHGARVFLRPGDTISGLRNFGTGQAGGKILVFLDADCTVAPSWLREAARYLDREDVAGFGSPPAIPIESTWVQRAWFRVRKKESIGETKWLESMNLFVPRRTFSHVGGFNEELVTCEDYDLSLRLKEQGLLIADERIIAVHHGEARSIRHFFRKEFWRARSNLKSVRAHAFEWRELPSLVLPVLHCLLALFVLGYALINLLVTDHAADYGLLMLFMTWQSPLALLALWKTRASWSARIASQLYILLNVYFLARGLAVFQRN